MQPQDPGQNETRHAAVSPPKPRRIRPARIAPLIPTWGLLAFVGVQQLGGTRWFLPFLGLITVLFLLLFWFVARQVLTARKLRKATRKIAD